MEVGLATIFTKIINKEIPADIVYEDDLCLSFKDISPQAPVHILLIPKKQIATMQEVVDDDSTLIGHIMVQIPKIAKKLELDELGYRVVINCKEYGGQEVNHLHIHILGARQMKWPPG